jgi:hypothetical protein
MFEILELEPGQKEDMDSSGWSEGLEYFFQLKEYTMHFSIVANLDLSYNVFVKVKHKTHPLPETTLSSGHISIKDAKQHVETFLNNMLGNTP